jgi:outer membrane protein OmpA-like peptidoglycan-associated protein
VSAPNTAVVITSVVIALTSFSTSPALANPTASPSTPPPLVVPLPGSQAVEWPIDSVALAPDDINNGGESMLFSTSSLTGDSTEIENGKQFVLKADVMFAYNKAKLTAKAKQLLTAVAGKITLANPARIVISGHTDSDGSDRYNLKLSKQRATAVRTYLATILPSSINIQATGMGETQPRISNKSTAGRALNRRVEIVIPS